MLYAPMPEKAVIRIESLFTFYHFQFATGYVFQGERHPFWEIVYVENGQVDIGADEDVLMLSGGDVIFHRPDEFHSIWANYAHAPELLVISFHCDSPAMRAFERQSFHLSDEHRQMLHALIREASHVFSTPLDCHQKIVSPGAIGGVYGLKLMLTSTLLSLLQYKDFEGNAIPRKEIREKTEAMSVLGEIVSFMRDNLRGEINFSDLCQRACMSETSVKRLFHRHFSSTPMAYYEQLRMAEARRLLRLPGARVTSVALEMGYANPTYFSTRFRRVSGMTPRAFLRDAQNHTTKR